MNKSYKVQISATSEQRISFVMGNVLPPRQRHAVEGDGTMFGMSQMHCSKAGDDPISKNTGQCSDLTMDLIKVMTAVPLAFKFTCHIKRI